MISNNYIPQWYTSPFQHVKYSLVRNQDQFDLMFDDVTETDTFMHMGCAAQVDYYQDGRYAVVQLGDTSERNIIEVYGLILHESVHIWQKIRELMGEKSPSTEFEAYSIQKIAQDLFWSYEQSEVASGMEQKTD